MDLDLGTERDNSSRVYLRRLIADFARELPDGARVLDAGGGVGHYAPLFERQTYENADREPGSTYVCDLHKIPVEDAVFDAALSTQTLEHVREPKTVLAEIARVLKPQSPLLVTAPFVFEEHMQPEDYYRYTSFGLRHLVESAGFQIVEIAWLEGFFGTLGYLLRTFSSALAQLDTGGYTTIDARVIRHAEGDLALLGQAFNDMDLRYKEVTAGFPKNYAIRAIKS